MSMNKVFASGRLTADPEPRELNGVSAATFTLACDTRIKDGNGGYITNFYRCTAWRGTAETCIKYLHRGDRASIVGDQCLRSYVDTKGVQRWSLDVSVTDVDIVFPKREDGGQPAQAANPAKAPTAQMPVEDGLPF